jgi:hypothetical protein
MGPKPKKKTAKNIRPTLPNPFIENVPQLEEKEVETILNLVVDKLKNIYPLPVSNKQIMDVIEPSTDISFSTLPKSERKEKFRDKRKEIRHSSDSKLNIELRKYISIGLKKCLKQLSTNSLCVLIFDTTINLEPMRNLFEKGLSNSPIIIGVPKLGECVKKSLGFPAICLGFINEILQAEQGSEEAHHFYPIIELIRTFVKSETNVLNSTCDIVSKGEKIKHEAFKAKIDGGICNKPQNAMFEDEIVENEKVLQRYTKMPNIEILYRKDTNSRVFIPELKKSSIKTDGAEHSDFLVFSEDIDAKRQKIM